MRIRHGVAFLEKQWFVPHVPGRGDYTVNLHGDPTGRTLKPAFSTRERCERAIELWFPHAQVRVEDDPEGMSDAARRESLTVALDIEDDGERWHYRECSPVAMSPGGDC